MRRINYLGGAETENDLVNVDVGCSERSYTMKDLLEDRTIAKRTAILCILWFATSLSAFGSDLNSRNLLGNFYVNQLASALMIALMKIFVFLLDTYYESFDRRKLHQIPQLLMIICYTTIMCLQMLVSDTSCDGESWNDWTIIAVNIMGVSFIELTWDACYLVAVECFPTHVRTIGMGTCSLFARIGALVAPQMAYLSVIYHPAPYIVVVSIGIISLGISVAFLPNTKGVDLASIRNDARKQTLEKMYNNAHNISTKPQV